jgi:uncharacterized protein YmfQ (DUF2313 family)
MPTLYWSTAPSTPSPSQGSPAISFSQESYVRMLMELLPRGPAFTREQDGAVRKAMKAIADELARIDARGVDLLDESDPRTADETIEDWERILSLPDDRVLTIPATLAERRVAITQKYVGRGGQNYEFYELLCAACGYTLISIDLFAGDGLFREGDRVDSRCYDEVFAYAMRLNLETPSGAALSQADFQRVVRHATHSHIQVMFTYS